MVYVKMDSTIYVEIVHFSNSHNFSIYHYDIMALLEEWRNIYLILYRVIKGKWVGKKLLVENRWIWKKWEFTDMNNKYFHVWAMPKAQVTIMKGS